MAYVRRPKNIVLQWADGDLAGLEVKTRPVNVDEFTAIARLRDGHPGKSGEEVDALDDLFDRFGEVLLSWNLEVPDDPADDGSPTHPVPATAEGLRSMDPGFALGVIAEWLEHVGDIDVPLGPGSSNGGPPAPTSIPMEPLSPGSPPS